jgi:hypothetical protein
MCCIERTTFATRQREAGASSVSETLPTESHKPHSGVFGLSATPVALPTGTGIVKEHRKKTPVSELYHSMKQINGKRHPVSGQQSHTWLLPAS